jgi:hypothetical protein
MGNEDGRVATGGLRVRGWAAATQIPLVCMALFTQS